VGNTKKNFKATKYVHVDWIHLAQKLTSGGLLFKRKWDLGLCKWRGFFW